MSNVSNLFHVNKIKRKVILLYVVIVVCERKKKQID